VNVVRVSEMQVRHFTVVTWYMLAKDSEDGAPLCKHPSALLISIAGTCMRSAS
jgi:hypothetical protein